MSTAALKADGSVVTWGDSDYGGDSSTVASQLSQVTQIFSTIYAFAALKADGSVVTWGSSSSGGDSGTVASQLSQVTQIFSTIYAFAALKADGSVVTWGHSDWGGNSSTVATQLSSGVVGFATPYTDDSFSTPTYYNKTFTLAENSTNNTLIGTLVATDPEGNNLTYSITWNSDPNNNGTPAFRLQGNQLLVNDQDDLDYETNPILSLTAQASDGSETNYATIIVNLTDVNEAPSFKDQIFTLPENSTNNTLIGTLRATDPEGDNLTYSITRNLDTDEDSTPAFRIQGKQLVVNDQEDLDSETNSSLNIAISVTDGQFSSTAVFRVNLINVNLFKTQSGREDDLGPTIFTLTRTGNLSSELTVNLLLQGTAKAGSDYTAPANLGANNTLTVTFAAGSATATLSLPTLADNVVDPYDNIVAILQPGNGYSITPGSDRAEVIIQAEGVTAVPNRRSYPDKSGGEYRNYSAFAALKKDGSVVTWGHSSWGGDSSTVASQLSQGVTQIFSTGRAFAALKADGSVVTWGYSSWGGDSSTVASQLSQVTQIFSTGYAFAALKADGSVVTWGNSSSGGDSSTVASQLSQVTQIFSTEYAFAALKADGSVVTWGNSFSGGDSSTVASQLSQGVTQIFSTEYAFAALKADGSVVTWGNSDWGGDSSSVASQLSQVTQIFSTGSAFAALKADGSVVTWGNSFSGGDSSTVASQLSQVTQIFSTATAFAALKADGSVVTWGNSFSGGDSSTVASQLSQGVTQIFSTEYAFAALKADGSVVTWGDRSSGGDSGTVASQLSQVTQIFSTGSAFAALKADGSVVTWGLSYYGGDSRSVASQLSQVTQIFSTGSAFAALKADGSVVTWGLSYYGGNSSTVASQLSSGVVGFATPYTDDSFNNAPTFNNQTFTLEENSTEGTVVGTLVATDPEGDNLTYSITWNSDPNNNGTPAFRLQGNQLLVNDQDDLDYETNPTLSLTAQASDGSETNYATIIVNLTDVNEKPIIISPNTVNVPENTKEVLTVQATDPEGDSLTFSIIEIADFDLFWINPNTGNLRFQTAPDFENPASAANTNTYQVLVAVTDNSLIDVQLISVTVTNVNEAPTFNNQTFTLLENSTEGTVIGTLVATDPEGDNFTYSITNNPDPNNNGTPAFQLQGSQLLVNDQEDLNYETNPTLSLTVQASDGSGTNDATITVNLTDVNEKPIIISPNTVNVPENTKEVLTVQAIDPEGDSLTFSIIGGADANLFQINPNTGNLRFKTAPDFENPASAANTNTYQVQVAVTDNSLYNVQDIRVNVTDVNEAPSFNNQTFALLENSTEGTVIGTLVATDPEGDNFTYSITNNPDPNNNGTPAFQLQDNRLLVNDQEDLNYETNPTLFLIAQASDGSLTNDATITVNLINVNEAPIFNITVNVPENTKEVLTVQATDPERDSLTFSIIGGADANLFQINPHTGNLSFEKAPDFENPASAANTNIYQVLVEVMDNGNLTAVQDIRVNVTDVNEAPSFNNQTFTLLENSTNNTLIGTLSATDPEEDTLTYSITNNSDPNNNGTPAFLLQGNQLLVNDQEDLNYETNPTLSITVQASDGSETDDATITVNLTDVIGEYGTLNNLNHLWQTITLNESYTNPVVIVGDPTFNGSDPVVSRLQNVGSNSFQLRLQEPNYLNNSYVNESVSYLVMEAGNWTLADGTPISAGTHNSNRLTSQGFETINLTDFDSTPTVLSQVQTFNESDWVTTRTQGQSSSSFQVAMQEEEAGNSGSHVTETIGWLAIKQGVTEKGDPLLEGGTTSRAYSHTPSTVSFSQSFDSPPSVIAKLGSYYEGDTANLRLGSITSTGFGVRVQEEQSLNSEILHTNESISFLALEGYS